MGSRHYIRLLDAFRDFNISLVLVHLGSWGEDSHRKKEEYISGLLVRDISFYKNSDLVSVLEEEKPDIVLFLSTETFAHRAFQRYCRHKAIPTIHLYHGLVSVVALDGKKEPFKFNLFGQIQFIFRQSYKSLFKAFPAYGKSLWRTSAQLSEWMRFFQDIVFRLLGRTIFAPADDAATSKCCVYTEADVKDAMFRFKLDANDVAVVGNPDLLTYGLTSESLGSMLKRDLSQFNAVMYIDTGLASFGSNFSSVDQYVEYVVSLSDQLKLQNRELIFKAKPHPVDYFEYLTEALTMRNIEIVGNDNFIERLKTCCACITEPSTLGLLPTLLGMPLFLARVPQIGTLLYGDIFTTYPRSRYLNDIDHFDELLYQEYASCDHSRVMAWIMKNSGPMPAAEMPRRVAQVVVDLVHKSADVRKAT